MQVQRRIVAVLGPSRASSDEVEVAAAVGECAARNGWAVLTGGGPGVMEAASRGAFEEGGLTIGVLPVAQATADYPNPWVEIPIFTGAGSARNAFNVLSAELCVAIGGGPGTLSEIALAMKAKIAGLVLEELEDRSARRGADRFAASLRYGRVAAHGARRLFPLMQPRTEESQGRIALLYNQHRVRDEGGNSSLTFAMLVCPCMNDRPVRTVEIYPVLARIRAAPNEAPLFKEEKQCTRPSRRNRSSCRPTPTRKLAPGEVYQPIVPPDDLRPEVTLWSIGLGVVMVVVFTAACVYMALRAGNAIEASIPIAILAIFFGKMRKLPSTILENVMVQCVGQAAGVVAAGATFVVPALYINQLPVAWWQIFLACCIGGFLGIVLIIPLRKYFVKDLHGELPFPEATAINEILVTGESSAGGAGKILLIAFAVGALFDFSVEAFHLWNSNLSSSVLLGGVGESIRFEIGISAIAALFGLGYIIGLRYASIIASGSVLAVLVMVPVIYVFGQHIPALNYAGKTYDIASMSSSAIFGAFVKPIGIGAIAISGLIGIIRMGKIVVGSVTLGFKGFSKDAISQDAPSAPSAT